MRKITKGQSSRIRGSLEFSDSRGYRDAGLCEKEDFRPG